MAIAMVGSKGRYDSEYEILLFVVEVSYLSLRVRLPVSFAFFPFVHLSQPSDAFRCPEADARRMDLLLS